MLRLFTVAIITIPLLTASAEEAFVMEEEVCCVVLQSGDQVRIANINGDISLQEWDSDQILIVYVLTGEDAAEIESIDVICEIASGVQCQVQYPEDWRGVVDAEVDFTVRLPKDTDLDLCMQTVNGDVALIGSSGSSLIEIIEGAATVDGFNGEVTVNVVSGEINLCNVPELAVVNSVNALITGTINEVDRDMEIATVNGSIDLLILSSAHVIISTISGEILVPGVQVQRELVGSTAEFGEGSFRIEIDSVSGDITINK